MVTVPFSRSRVTAIPSKHYDTFSEQRGIVDIEGRIDERPVLRVDVDAKSPTRGFPPGVRESKASLPLGRFVVEFFVAGCHLHVHFLHDVDVQKRGVAVVLPTRQVVLRRDHQYHAEALETVNRWERAASVDPSTITRALRGLWQSLAPAVMKLAGQA